MAALHMQGIATCIHPPSTMHLKNLQKFKRFPKISPTVLIMLPIILVTYECQQLWAIYTIIWVSSIIIAHQLYGLTKEQRHHGFILLPLQKWHSSISLPLPLAQLHTICHQCYLKQFLTSFTISVETSIQFTKNYNFSILPQNANITPGLQVNLLRCKLYK